MRCRVASICHVLLPVLAFGVVAAACDRSTSELPSDSASTVSVGPTAIAESEYVESFEFAWSTLDEEFYDPEFGGLDWQAVHDRYLPRVVAAVSDEEFIILVNEMLWELGVSHLGVVPAGQEEQVDPILMAAGDLGLDVRIVNGEGVITVIEEGSAAAKAGLRPGYVLESISDQTIDQIIASVSGLPPTHERGIRSTQTNAVRGYLFGEVGSVVTIGYQTADGTSQEATLAFRRRASMSETIPGLPPAFVELRIQRLDGGIGYIGFNAFVPALLTPISDAIEEMTDAPGLIIDLRGNHGGVFEVRKGLVDRLVDQPDLLWTFVGRHTSDEIYVEPADFTYDGPIVVLVDVLSSSSAEEFAGGLQAIGRATVIGEHTAGRVLIMDVIELPNGALLLYPTAQTILADGTVLEGHGVIPDLPVAIDRIDLLAGVDAPLEAAINHLLSGTEG